MTVKNLLRREYEVIAPDVAVASIEDRLVRDSFLAVMDEGKFIGLLTPSDIIQHPHKLVIDCLTDKPCVDCESKIEFVLELMQNSHNLALPVCKKNKFIGIIVHEDISDNFSEYRKELEEKVAERTAELTKTIEHLKWVTEDLRETHDYLENLINYANAPIIVWNPDFRIKRFNHAFEHLTGYKSDDVVGKALSILFPDAGRKVSLDKIKATSNGEYWESVEISILCKDGDIRLALWNSANIYAEDGKTLVSTIAQGT
ncbi:PAS domain S-box protein, partial [bacterium]|nr:PAS domain S-box protein [bacterium]